MNIKSGYKKRKIDIYTDKNGDMYFRTQKGNPYKPIDDKYKQL